MQPPCLHTFCGNCPMARVKIHFVPGHAANFPGPRCRKRGKLQGSDRHAIPSRKIGPPASNVLLSQSRVMFHRRNLVWLRENFGQVSPPAGRIIAERNSLTVAQDKTFSIRPRNRLAVSVFSSQIGLRTATTSVTWMFCSWQVTDHRNCVSDLASLAIACGVFRYGIPRVLPLGIFPQCLRSWYPFGICAFRQGDRRPYVRDACS